MKNFLMLLIIAIAIISCDKGNNSDSGNQRIVIKGTVSKKLVKNAASKSTNSASISDAKNVLLFNSSGSYKLYSINDSSFSAKAVAGTATALVFLDENNKYIGCLNAGGINVLPLVSLKNGDNTVIDLSNLTLNADLVLPTNNPIGNEIDLSDEEIARYKEFGAYFKSLSQNIDADNDEVPDFLSQKGIYVSTIFTIKCGSYGVNNTSPVINDTSTFSLDYTIRVSGGKSLIPTNSTITLEGPEGSPYGDIQQTHYATGPDCFIAFFRRQPNQPFADGTYKLTLDSKEYDLKYSNINASYFFILAEPTIHTNSNNEITSITVEYKDVLGNTIIPENFVYQTQVTLNSGVNQLCQIGALWEDPEAKTNTELYTFVPTNTISLSSVTNVTVSYIDLIGNTYNNSY